LDQARARRAAIPAPAPDPGQGGQVELDWGLVAAFRTLVSDRIAAALGRSWHAAEGGDGRAPSGPTMDKTAQEDLGRAVIADLLSEHAADAVTSGATTWTPLDQQRMAEAVFNAVFRLGRLQPLVDDDRVENIYIVGCRRVLLELTDGRRVPGPAVADSDEELIDFLRFLASRSESNPRPFSESTPKLHMKLDGGARLAATAWVVTVPTVVIRRHRLQVVTLDDWVDRDCLTPAAASFLAAAVRGAWSIVVAGPMSAGKTTLARALCAQIPAHEAIGTFETEYELFLDQSGNHEIVVAWEARPGVGEIGPDGRPAGAFDLDEALKDSFRFALARQIVGEIRGREVWTMIKAMESGTGSLSTTHAADAEACLRKLVTCAMEAGPHVTHELATTKLSECLDVIVQVNRQVVRGADGTQVLRRWVSEIVVVEPGEKEKGYALTHVFGPSSDGPARATGVLPQACRDLAAHGFDLVGYLAESRGRGAGS
jgi:Flp pilus assembly CpaF family ATPase